VIFPHCTYLTLWRAHRDFELFYLYFQAKYSNLSHAKQNISFLFDKESIFYAPMYAEVNTFIIHHSRHQVTLRYLLWSGPVFSHCDTTILPPLASLVVSAIFPNIRTKPLRSQCSESHKTLWETTLGLSITVWNDISLKHTKFATSPNHRVSQTVDCNLTNDLRSWPS
jgi:hypothetical protein